LKERGGLTRGGLPREISRDAECLKIYCGWMLRGASASPGGNLRGCGALARALAALPVEKQGKLRKRDLPVEDLGELAAIAKRRMGTIGGQNPNLARHRHTVAGGHKNSLLCSTSNNSVSASAVASTGLLLASTPPSFDGRRRVLAAGHADPPN
jgi:hypothetical protein